MEERLNAFYTKGAAGSRCLAVRIINSKETGRILLSLLINAKREAGGERECKEERKEELACLSLLMRVNIFSFLFLYSAVLGWVDA